MEFRKAIESDINGIMSIIEQAQRYFKECGIDQWQNNYPNCEVIRKDIASGNGFVLLKENTIVGTVAVSFDGEKTYNSIYKGKWLSHDTYAVVHRIAIENESKGQGLSLAILKNIEELCLDKGVHSIKVDTHKDNLSMQKFLEKNGFKYCGIIYLEDKNERIAFEKII